MIPRLFEIPGLGWPINSYGFMIMVGFLLATWIAVRRAKDLGIESDLILDIGIISMIAGIIGAKINYVLQYPQQSEHATQVFDLTDGMSWIGGLLLGWIPFAFWYWRTGKTAGQIRLWSWQNGVLLLATLIFTIAGTRIFYLLWHRGDYDWKAILSSWQSGFVLYGSLLAGIPAGILYIVMRRAPLAKILDISAPSIMIGVAFGRIGCLLNGCCWGTPTTLPWGLSFPATSDAARQILADQKEHKFLDAGASSPLPVHPTQVYEALAAFAIFFVLSWFWRKKKKVDGETMLVLGMLYPAWRFAVEFIRGDDRPTWLGALSYSQTLSLGLFILCAVWMFMLRTKPPAEPPVKEGLASEVKAGS